MSYRGSRNSLRQRAKCTPVVSRSFEYHSGDSTFWLGSTPILRGNTLGMVRGFHQSSPSTNLMRGLAAHGYLEYPHAAKTKQEEECDPPAHKTLLLRHFSTARLRRRAEQIFLASD
ncbi:hypothetical protein TNCV_2537361 [Trichonephila clavipes]|nr:hypothetical protein TNCV_2537361 [Trichonephila clavipes]